MPKLKYTKNNIKAQKNDDDEYVNYVFNSSFLINSKV